MRIVFDAYWWIEGPTSLRHVLRETVTAWAEEFPDDEILLVVRRRHLARAREDAGPTIRVVPSALRPQALLASIGTERVRRRNGFDAVVTQNFAARSRGTSGVYLHDVLFADHPEWFTGVERQYFSFMVAWARRADVVFSSTAAEGERIRRVTCADHVVPVGLGLSTELAAGAHRPVEGLERGRFVLSVGRLNVRKNLETTIDAALDSGAVTPDAPLVVVGAGDIELSALPRVREAVEAGSVRFLGHVTDGELRWLYAGARLFVMLSLGEGFGMPPVEARHFGAPVLASDLAVFHETLGSEARFVDPLDRGAIARAVAAGMAEPWPDEDATPSTMAERHDWRRTVRTMRTEIAAAAASAGGVAG